MLSPFKSISSEPIQVQLEENGISKFVEQVLTEANILIEYPKFVKSISKLDPNLFASTLFPKASARSSFRIQLFKSAILFIILCTLYDDAREDSWIHVDELIQLKQALSSPQELTAYHSCWIRAFQTVGYIWNQENVPKRWLEAITDRFTDYVKAIHVENDYRLKGFHLVNLSNYLSWRQNSSGGRFGPLLVELVYGFVEEERYLTHPFTEKLFDLFNLITIYQNDYVSWKTGRDENRMNLVFCLSNEFHLTPESSGEMVLQLHDKTVKEFGELFVSLSIAYPLFEQYLIDLKSMLVGVSFYHERSARFKASS